MIHKLKIQKEYLDGLTSGRKKCEIRINDRDYQRGDVLQFYDYSKTEPVEHLFEVTHIHSGLGMDRNYVVLSVSELTGS
jgi:ASC-1-like (ASCH) protein